jgi:phosphatidylinositol glycan class P protein
MRSGRLIAGGRVTGGSSSAATTPVSPVAAVAENDDLLNEMDGKPTTVSKTPTYEYSGFVLYLLSLIFYCLFLCWAYLPDHVLHQIGIYYYIQRYWALALPCYGFACILFTLTATVCWDLFQTPALHSIHTITGKFKHIHTKYKYIPIY